MFSFFYRQWQFWHNQELLLLILKLGLIIYPCLSVHSALYSGPYSWNRWCDFPWLLNCYLPKLSWWKTMIQIWDFLLSENEMSWEYLWNVFARTIWEATPWARVANFVKKPPLISIVYYLELSGFNASMWVFWSLSDLKKSQCFDWNTQIHQICVNKH